MYIEKPKWVNHGGHAIFSIDIHPDGTRFATAGGDHVVRIWNLDAVKLGEESLKRNAPRRLASLCDHFGPVNCVRWSHDGRHVASGSDDKLIMVHEKRPGGGTVEFGCSEQTNLENWKLVLTLRGHASDVVDISWSPCDSQIASCSLDNTVKIFDAAMGTQIATLCGHTSLVKGVSWDPIGSFIATQSDDKSVIIWKTSDWSKAAQVGATFFRRLDWSPCGTFLTTTHAFENPQHTAAVIERSDWSKVYDFIGHVAPVVAVRYCNTMFRRPKKEKCTTRIPKSTAFDSQIISPVNNSTEDANEVSDQKNKQLAGSRSEHNNEQKSEQKIRQKNMNGDGVNENVDDDKANENHENGWRKGIDDIGLNFAPYHCLALGSQDYQLTVWVTSRFQPIVAVKNVFVQPVVDLSWSVDGKILLSCSSDGSVAALIFDTDEIGTPLTKEEIEKIKKEKYGDFQVRNFALPECPALLNLQLASSAFKTKKPSYSGLPEIEGVKRSELNDKFDAKAEVINSKDNPAGDLHQHLDVNDSVTKFSDNDAPIKDKTSESNANNAAKVNGVIHNLSIQREDDKQGLAKTLMHNSSASNQEQTCTALVAKNNEKQPSAEILQKQIVVRRSDGRRRITPVSLNTLSDANPTSTSSQEVKAKHDHKDFINDASMNRNVINENNFGNPDSNVNKSEVPGGMKRSFSGSENNAVYERPGAEENEQTDIKRSKLHHDGGDFCGTKNSKKEKINDVDDNYLSYGDFPRNMDESRKVERVLIIEGKDNIWNEAKSTVDISDKRKVLFVEVRNIELGDLECSWTLQTSNFRNSSESSDQVVCFREQKMVWNDKMEDKVSCLTGNRHFWAVACNNGVLQVYSPQGRRSLPPIICRSAICMMTCNEDYNLLVLTRAGDLLMWHLGLGSNILDESISPLLSFTNANSEKPLRVHSIRITQKNEPVIYLECGNCFTFNIRLNSWLRVSENAFPCSSFSSCWPNNRLFNRDAQTNYYSQYSENNDKNINVEKFPIGIEANNNETINFVSIQETLHRVSQKNTNYFSQYQSLLLNRQGFEGQSRAHLEEKLSACEIFNMPYEYKKNLVLYVRHLTREGDENRLRELCEEFLGPIHIQTKCNKRGDYGYHADVKHDCNFHADHCMETNGCIDKACNNNNNNSNTNSSNNNTDTYKDDYVNSSNRNKSNGSVPECGDVYNNANEKKLDDHRWDVKEWDPFKMGLDKRKILREDILPVMVSNRALHRLLNEFLDLLDHIS